MVKSSTVQLDTLFHALSDSTRRAILRDIAGKQKTVGEVARPYRMSLPAVSKHLTVLETANLVVRERRGSFQVVHLNATTLKTAAHWLRFYEQFWNSKLDVLQSLLEGEANE
jgi:DNA-binding transcriptional ArsR family regulator